MGKIVAHPNKPPADSESVSRVAPAAQEIASDIKRGSFGWLAPVGQFLIGSAVTIAAVMYTWGALAAAVIIEGRA